MKLQLNDLQLVVFLGICSVAWVFTMIAAASVRQFVREHEPELASRFAFASRRRFLSLQTSPDRDPGEEDLFQWLQGGGATDLIERHPNFSVHWKRYRRAVMASSILISLWLVVSVWHLAQGGLNVG
jgi:hypothetical protein